MGIQTEDVPLVRQQRKAKHLRTIHRCTILELSNAIIQDENARLRTELAIRNHQLEDLSRHIQAIVAEATYREIK
jgi:hypothetical protein